MENCKIEDCPKNSMGKCELNDPSSFPNKESLDEFLIKNLQDCTHYKFKTRNEKIS